MITTIQVLAWIGLTVVTVLSAATIYYWALWLWEYLLENIGFPVGLWTATKLAVQLKMTKDKNAFVGHYVGAQLDQAERESPEFKEALMWYRKENNGTTESP